MNKKKYISSVVVVEDYFKAIVIVKVNESFCSI